MNRHGDTQQTDCWVFYDRCRRGIGWWRWPGKADRTSPGVIGCRHWLRPLSAGDEVTSRERTGSRHLLHPSSEKYRGGCSCWPPSCCGFVGNTRLVQLYRSRHLSQCLRRTAPTCAFVRCATSPRSTFISMDRSHAGRWTYTYVGELSCM